VAPRRARTTEGEKLECWSSQWAESATLGGTQHICRLDGSDMCPLACCAASGLVNPFKAQRETPQRRGQATQSSPATRLAPRRRRASRRRLAHGAHLDGRSWDRPSSRREGRRQLLVLRRHWRKLRHSPPRQCAIAQNSSSRGGRRVRRARHQPHELSLALAGHRSGTALWQPLPVDRLASVMDAGRARLRTVRERLQQVGQLRVAVDLHQPRHAVAPAPAARLTDDRECWPSDIGQDERAIARHGPEFTATRVAHVAKVCIYLKRGREGHQKKQQIGLQSAERPKRRSTARLRPVRHSS
jgi:hypothetical protein